MKNFLKNFVARETPWSEKLSFLTMIGILVFTYFPIQYLISSGYNDLLDSYSDFASIKIYLSMVLAAIFVALTITEIGLKNFLSNYFILIVGLWIVLMIGYSRFALPGIKANTISSMLVLGCAFLFGYAVYKSKIWLKYRESLLWTIIIVAVTQSAIALVQFTFLQSLGLNVLGESRLDIFGYGIAKIVSHGTLYLRGYGTLPHPNVLSALLLISSLFNLYLLNKSSKLFERAFLSLSYFVITLGLIITFSRAGYLAFLLGTLYFLITCIRGEKYVLFMKKFWIIPVSLIIWGVIFFPWLNSRKQFYDQAVTERLSYDMAGQEILLNNWFLGTGPGSNLFHMKLKLQDSMDPWNIQPIHNYFLIFLSEYGIIGLVIILLLIYILYLNFRKSLSDLYQGQDNMKWTNLLASISLSIFILFWFDHYFYTLWPTQLMLWLILGLAYQANKKLEDQAPS